MVPYRAHRQLQSNHSLLITSLLQSKTVSFLDHRLQLDLRRRPRREEHDEELVIDIRDEEDELLILQEDGGGANW